MKAMIRTMEERKGWFITGFVTVVLLCLIFCALFTSHVSAESGDMTAIHGYERILVRPGDTLDGLAETYSSRYSYESTSEYKAKIIRLNNLASDYLFEGKYLIMPLCK